MSIPDPIQGEVFTRHLAHKEFLLPRTEAGSIEDKKKHKYDPALVNW